MTAHLRPAALWVSIEHLQYINRWPNFFLKNLLFCASFAFRRMDQVIGIFFTGYSLHCWLLDRLQWKITQTVSYDVCDFASHWQWIDALWCGVIHYKFYCFQWSYVHALVFKKFEGRIICLHVQNTLARESRR